MLYGYIHAIDYVLFINSCVSYFYSAMMILPTQRGELECCMLEYFSYNFMRIVLFAGYAIVILIILLTSAAGQGIASS